MSPCQVIKHQFLQTCSRVLIQAYCCSQASFSVYFEPWETERDSPVGFGLASLPDNKRRELHERSLC